MNIISSFIRYTLLAFVLVFAAVQGASAQNTVQASLRQNPTTPNAVDIMVKSTSSYPGAWIVYNSFAVQLPTTSASGVTPVLSVPSGSLLAANTTASNFSMATAQDYSYTTYAWTEGAGYTTTPANIVAGTEYVLATITFGGAPLGATSQVRLVDYQNQSNYGGATNIAVFVMDMNNGSGLIEGANFGSLFYQTTGSAAPTTDNDGGSSNQSVATLGNISLPVGLSAFTATENNCAAELSWTASDEKNMSGYEVQYSSNGKNFNKVGFVAAQNEIGDIRYSYTYAQPDAEGYYRLNVLKRDGKATYSSIVKMKNNCASGIELSVIPNPAQGDAALLVKNGIEGGAGIDVFDMSGRLVWHNDLKTSTGTQTVTLPCSQWASGGYMVRYVESNGKAHSLKLQRN